MKTMSSLLLALAVVGFAACSNPFMSDADMITNGRAQLESRLVMPEGGRELKPAVVFAVGSGTAHFDEYVEGFTETLLEDIFLPRDIAVLYINKRGVGDSSGNYRWGSIERQADDILAAVEHLRATPGIDPDQIGLVGHSQGGWVVQLAGSLDEGVAFVVSLAGPTVAVVEQDAHRVENDFRCEGANAEEVQDGLDRLSRKHERIIRVARWFPFFELRYASNIYQFDPRTAITNLTQPTLLAFGGLDNMVPPEPNLERLEEIFPAGVPSYITAHVADSTDHMFRMANTICFDYEASIGNPYSDPFVAYLESWVDGLGVSL
jgi:pimeloyl-ACP methyl ester carboxylesterase